MEKRIINNYFKNKIVLITASTSGIGAELAKRLSSEGSKVIINYHRDQIKAEVMSSYGSIYKADVNDFDQFKNMVDYIKDTYGGLDILINNYGPILYDNLSQIKPDEFKSVLEQNIMPTFYGCKLGGELMIEKDINGRIVNISTAGADSIKPKNKTVPYHIGKNGVVMLTRSFAMLYAKNNITVNSVGPGILDIAKDAEEGSLEGTFKIPMIRKGTVEDIIDAVLFLISDQAAYITGENINVDGGWEYL